MISIIIPLYNERENIQTYNTDLFPVIEQISSEYDEIFEYVLVDDGSRDDTYALIQAIAAQRGDVVAVTNGTNKGMGAAIKNGFSHARGDLFVTMDSDLTFRPEDIRKLLDAYRDGHPDCVSGSPYREKGLMEEVTFFRYVLSASVNTLYRVLLASDITCVSPIFRLYPKRAITGMNIRSNNFEINAEIIAKMLIAKRNVVEVPVKLYRRTHGESKIKIGKEIRNNIYLLGKIAKTKFLKVEWD